LKRFERFTLTCGSANVLVGPNNSGKSTLLDALRILYGVLRYAVRYRPKLINARGGQLWGYEIPDSSIPIDLTNISSNYDDDDAEIEFTHASGTKLNVLLHPTRLTRVHIPSASRMAASAHTYFKGFGVDVVVVPTLSPFEQAESWVQDETIERNRASRLGSRYFRNIWYRSSPQDFEQLKNLVEETWPQVTVNPVRPTHAHAVL
jgi:energy-coupling factor transporter ATP-binding protein EcfA2